MLDLALCKSETFLPSPQSIHEFVVSFSYAASHALYVVSLQYELVRSSSVLKKQVTLLRTLSLPYASSTRRTSWVSEPRELLSHILSVTEFYEEKVTKAGASSARDAMEVVSQAI